MGALKEYDPKQVVISWDGVDVSEGIAEGTFITIASVTRDFTLNVGGDGGGTRVRNNDNSATIEVTLRRGSITNDLLSSRIQDERKDPPVKHVGQMTITDFSGNTMHTFDGCFLDGPADDEYGTEESTVTWTFMALKWTPDHKGNKDA